MMGGGDGKRMVGVGLGRDFFLVVVCSILHGQRRKEKGESHHSTGAEADSQI